MHRFKRRLLERGNLTACCSYFCKFPLDPSIHLHSYNHTDCSCEVSVLSSLHVRTSITIIDNILVTDERELRWLLMSIMYTTMLVVLMMNQIQNHFVLHN